MLKPGSQGEHELQELFGTQTNALAFYNNQVLDHLNPRMQEFLARQEMMFISTSSAEGECDCSFRAGKPGFVQLLDPQTILFPEYKGNGVMASLGNIHENPHIGLLFLDMFQSTIGLHINGKARFFDNEGLPADLQKLEGVINEQAQTGKYKPVRWVMVNAKEVYIHCSKHVPLVQRCAGDSVYCDFDDVKAGDFFGAKTSPRPWNPNNPEPSVSIPTNSETNKAEKICSHLDQIKDFSFETGGCEDCLKTGETWSHLRQCLTCGYVGCCDESKNKHATAHFQSQGHPIIKSLERGENWRWCFSDEIVI